MSEIALFADVPTRKFTSAEGGSPELLTLVEGDQLKCALNLQDRSSGELVGRNDLHIRTIRASLGWKQLPPTLGTFRLLGVADVLSPAIAFNADAATFQTAIAGILGAGITVAQTILSGPSCWLFRVNDGSLVEEVRPTPRTVHTGNLLVPLSFVRVRAYQGASDEWWHEVRLVQTPLAFSGLFDRVLPPPPSVTRIRAGSAGDIGNPVNTNEVQAIEVPVEFKGTYYIKWNYRTTIVLGIQDGPDQIAAALNSMFTDGIVRFTATVPEDQHAYVEFVGPLEKLPQPLMEIVVFSFEVGVPTFTLDLDRAQLHNALATVSTIEKLPFEVEVELVDDPADLDDLSVPGRPITFQMEVTLSREQVYPELGVVSAIDFLRPPQPKDYVPFTPDQIITGEQFFLAVRGNGVATTFPLDHGLASDAIAFVMIRENKPNGRMLSVGIDFDVNIDNADTVTVIMTDVYPVNGLAIVLMAAGPKAAFQAHTHTIGQIVGLQAYLDSFAARLTNIENKLPFTNPGTPAVAGGSLQIAIPDFYEVFPGRFEVGHDHKLGTPPSRPPALNPAIHTNAALASVILDNIDPVTNAGLIWKSNVVTTVPGGFGHRSLPLAINDPFASDGRMFYKMVKDAAKNSYFPVDMERELFFVVVNDYMLRPGQAFRLEFDLALQMLKANTRTQFLLNIEAGTAPQDATPSPVGVNLQNVVWNATPLISLRLVVGPVQESSKLGVSIARSLTDVFSADVLTYNTWIAAVAGSKPSSANFVLRARLLQFDTENSVASAVGSVFVALTGASAKIS